MTALALLDDDAGHAQPGHPERPGRLAAVRTAIAADPALAALGRVVGAPAPRAALERIHDPAYLDLIEAVSLRGGADLDVDTYATGATWDVVTRGCGNLLAVVDAVCTGEATNGFAVARPPGHHARPMRAMGFCFLANVAVAAKHAQAAHGVGRVLVVDLDAHHGNGTQEALYADPSVVAVSIHQADIFPGSGFVHETGAGAGEGATVNLPLPAGTGDEAAALLREILPPLAARVRPDLVLCAFGTDAHRLDPLAGLAMSVAGLADALGVVQEVADAHAGGRLVLSLEGGYHVGALAASVAAGLRRLLDPAAEVADPFGPTAHPARDLGAVAAAVRGAHEL